MIVWGSFFGTVLSLVNENMVPLVIARIRLKHNYSMVINSDVITDNNDLKNNNRIGAKANSSVSAVNLRILIIGRSYSIYKGENTRQVYVN